MKRIFRLYLKEHKIRFVSDFRETTIAFNKWVGQAKIEGHKRFLFKAHTNKHIIAKWCDSFDIPEHILKFK